MPLLSLLLLLLLLLLPLLTAAFVAAFEQVLAKADPTALAASAEVVRGKLVTASAIAKGEVRLGVYCSTCLDQE